jgi:hypothetical protein
VIHLDLIGAAAQHEAELPVSDLWVLMARSQLWEADGWLSRWLWVHRWASFLAQAEGYCACCGRALSGWARGDAVYCGAPCRQRAHRRRAKGELTSFGQAVAAAVEDLRQLEADLVGFRAWYRKNRSATIMPPDLLRIEHLPRLPGRCGRGCGRGTGCSHTDGGPCLFANTCRSGRDG